MSTVCILDYGSGNVRSVYNALLRIDANVEISNSEKSIKNSSHIILPGVGSYSSAMEKISKNLPMDILMKEISDGKPLLGICVGMQVFSTVGMEFVEAKGLDIFANSKVRELTTDLPKPHMGWNSVDVKTPHPIMEGVPNQSDFYFVHSFIIDGLKFDEIIGETNYGEKFPSIITKNNVVGVQFHPEKSQKHGQAILNNFAKWVP